MVEEQLGARSKPAGSFSLQSFSFFLSAPLKSRGLVVAVGWCAHFHAQEVQVVAMEQDSPVCCKPVSPSCSIAGCRALAAPRQQRAGPLQVKTDISVTGDGDVPAGSLEKAPLATEL